MNFNLLYVYKRYIFKQEYLVSSENKSFNFFF